MSASEDQQLDLQNGGGLPQHFEWSKTESVWQQLSCEDAKKTEILEVCWLWVMLPGCVNPGEMQVSWRRNVNMGRYLGVLFMRCEKNVNS